MGRTLMIAEAGVNHNGSLEMAHRLIDAAADAGADAVKFQTFQAKLLVTHHAAKAEYQKRQSGSDESQYDMLSRLQLDEESHRQLMAHCRDRDIRFLSTPFDPVSLQWLTEGLGLPCIKFSSGDITNGPLLLQAAQAGVSVIVSTGMSTLGEVEDALAVLAFGYTNAGVDRPDQQAIWQSYRSDAGQEKLRQHVTLLHCTSEYPAPDQDVNLRAIHTLQTAFGLPVGLSDHTEGIAIPIAAAALGATVIEKHFTLDRRLPGPDHQASLEPGELRDMITSIRRVEQALGTGLKAPAPSEASNQQLVRKSIVAARPIRAGELFSAQNLVLKRPGGGCSPMAYWELLGQPARTDYEPDEQVRS